MLTGSVAAQADVRPGTTLIQPSKSGKIRAAGPVGKSESLLGAPLLLIFLGAAAITITTIIITNNNNHSP